MKSSIVKRSIELHGHKTSISLEDEFWNGLRAIADERRTPLAAMLNTIDGEREAANLSSAIRVFVLNYFVTQKRQTAPAHPGAATPRSAAAPFPC